jgi:hypothetical protein
MSLSKNFRWQCCHDKGTGKDRERCDCRGEWTTKEKAVQGGKEHNEEHRWSGWGYAPMGWRNKTVNIFEKTSSGIIEIAVSYDKL